MTDNQGLEKARATAAKIDKEVKAAAEPQLKAEDAGDKALLESVGKKTAPKKAETEEKSVEVPKVEEMQIATIKPAEIDPRTGQIQFTPKHLELIKTQIAKDATPEEYDLFIMMARRTRLDPLLKQLYFIKYKGKDGRPDQVSYVTSIDSYRIIAHRTEAFAGVDLPIYEYDKNSKITHCSITVYKLVHGQKFGFSAKVKFSEYNTGKQQWASKPETMIAKVAEAHALRKAFPQDLSGVYTTDEMEQAGITVDGNTGKVVPQTPMITKAQVGKIKDLMMIKGVEVQQLKDIVQQGYKRTSMKDMSQKQAGHLIGKLQAMPDLQPDPDIQADDGEALPDDDSFGAFAANELGEGPEMPGIDLDEVDAGVMAQMEA